MSIDPESTDTRLQAQGAIEAMSWVGLLGEAPHEALDALDLARFRALLQRRRIPLGAPSRRWRIRLSA